MKDLRTKIVGCVLVAKAAGLISEDEFRDIRDYIIFQLQWDVDI